MKRFGEQGPGLRGEDQGDPSHARIFNAPSVVSWLALFIIACHVAYLVLPEAMKVRVAWYGAVSPQRFLHGEGGLLAMLAPLVGHMLLHGGWLHLLFNTIWLMAFGAPVARRLGAERPRAGAGGSAIFVLFFILSGVAGAISYIAVHPDETTMMIGASGGVSGLLGGLVRFAFRSPFAPPGGFAGLFDRSVLTWTGAIIALNILAGFFGSGLAGADTDIAWESHIGGYLFGLLTFPVFARLTRRP